MTAAGLSRELAGLAERLRRVTVQLRSGTRGAGAGIVWAPDGLVVTNAHLLRDPRPTVVLADGRSFAARIVRSDPARDLAELRIRAADLPAAVVGDPDVLRSGELVLAVGHPLGVAGALAVGTVHEVVPGRWIRTGARLAPGNSGGPLADVHGRVVGVNTLIAGGSGAAIPADAVARFLRGHNTRAA